MNEETGCLWKTPKPQVSTCLISFLCTIPENGTHLRHQLLSWCRIPLYPPPFLPTSSLHSTQTHLRPSTRKISHHPSWVPNARQLREYLPIRLGPGHTHILLSSQHGADNIHNPRGEQQRQRHRPIEKQGRDAR